MNEKIASILTNPKTPKILFGISAFSAGVAVGMIIEKVINKSEEEDEGIIIYSFDGSDPITGIDQLPFGLDVDEYVNDVTETKSPVFVRVDEEIKPKVSKPIIFDEEHQDDDDDDDDEVAEDSISEVQLINGVVVGIVQEEEPPVGPEVHNIFAGSIPGWDYSIEVPLRKDNAPYIISVDEFMADEFSFHQTSLVYYAGDDILCDEKNIPIYNYKTVVGDLRFGHGSNDPTLVYIRNHENRAEYEVQRNDGHYAHEVLGYEYESEAEQDEIRHSRNLKFRLED